MVVYMYEWAYDDWIRVGEIIGKRANENFGYKDLGKSYNGKIFIGGSPYVLYGNPDKGAGNARVYKEVASNKWEQVGADLDLVDGAAGDQYSHSVDM